MKHVFLLAAGLLPMMMGTTALANPLNQYNTKDFFLGTVDTGLLPKGMLTTLDGKKLYVADMAGRRIEKGQPLQATVTIIDVDQVKTHKVLRTPTGPRPYTLGNIEVALTDDGRYALVTRLDGCGDGGIKCPKTHKPSEVLPTPMVFAIDTRTDEIVKMIPTRKAGFGGGMGPKVIAVRPKRSPELAYVANYFSHDITVMDIANLGSGPKVDAKGDRIVGAIKLTTKSKKKKIAPRGIAFTADGTYAIVAGAESNSIFLIDTVNHKQIAELPAPTNKINFRHIVVNRDATVAYISHMLGDSVSRIDFQALVRIARSKYKGEPVLLATSVWDEIFIPFPSAKGPVNLLKLDIYPSDHPNFPNKTWFRSNPNTIVLDPVTERYLYVSFRTTGKDYDGVDESKLTPMNQFGKVDILDLHTGKVVKSLVSGVEPTALAVTPDNNILMSSGFRDNKIYFYDLGKLLSIYERGN